ncbi:receptor-like protein 6 [Alnus glutinosa]|uniref:receptor-like protein 6 n=1 Tax=Alnus glutinosa TaxID=3517 RepID=UPI002D79CFD4|nr:receptor-like protein 6 [Alnus glutinosa]
MSIFEVRGLEGLSLGSNKFNNSLDFSVIQPLKFLFHLDLSHIHLLTEYNDFYLSLFAVQFDTITLASCKMKKFPDFLRNQSNLFFLDLSNNQIHGELPNWIWKLSDLRYLNISYNYLKTLEGPISNISFKATSLNFRSNQFQGQLPILPPVSHLDFSINNFHSALPASIGQSLEFAYFFSISNNKLYGSIPGSICKATHLRFLDLSDNYLSGTIPQCLIENGYLLVLKLKRNKLNGTIPDTFSDCNLQTLAINQNQLEGELPKSLKNCHGLEVLDIGNNIIKDTFPFYLNTISLKVLILRSNKFYGPIAHPELNTTWPILQILDAASNNFIGHLPIVLLST